MPKAKGRPLNPSSVGKAPSEPEGLADRLGIVDLNKIALRTGYQLSYLKQLSRHWGDADDWLNGGRVWLWESLREKLPPAENWPINQ